ncbi:MAG: hypothetical protein SGARI_007389, partial [Bacillariaceae sp.]
MRIAIAATLLLAAVAAIADGFVLPTPPSSSAQHSRRSMVAPSPDDIDIDEEQQDDMPIKVTKTTTASFNPSSKPIRRYQALKKEPLIAILGRPNVGKSALVNRIAGSHQGGAIVADEEGITRDRTYRQANFLGENFQVVDTGGLVFDDDESTLFAKEIRQQAMVAIDESSGVVLVVDGQVGLTAMDQTIADFLRKEVLPRMPVMVAVNKCESEKTGGLNAA